MSTNRGENCGSEGYDFVTECGRAERGDAPRAGGGSAYPLVDASRICRLDNQPLLDEIEFESRIVIPMRVDRFAVGDEVVLPDARTGEESGEQEEEEEEEEEEEDEEDKPEQELQEVD